MRLSRRLALMGVLGLAGCAGDDAPRSFQPLRFDYLTPLQLNVGSIEVAELPPPGPLDSESPTPAGPALRQMAEDRLSAAGTAGRAVVTIDQARITRRNGGLDGAFAMHLDIKDANGRSAGYAEALVSRRKGDIGRDLRGGLYEITKQMLDDMNIELEFQIRRSLKDYLQATSTAPAPAAVQQQDLSAPRSY
jgi:hypothetical protein